MKTTIDIADGLFAEAKQRAKQDGTTFRALVERGLGIVLAAPASGPPFAAVTGALEPLPGVDPRNWGAIRDDIYKP